ncbi:regulator of ribosome biosynthesis [Nematocida displodere]|uniref:Ribosome biogenesis regulatory protein n=1 Tax=Nematocida displodere TaxID=1805483 RepID=A0A177EGN6_9MICR|nr:regulator of ribosome biosynthesis [Nematocida displodere]
MEEVYDTKSFIAIGESRENTEKLDSYKSLLSKFFKKLRECPTKYDLYNLPIYILPAEILPHTKEYSKETVFPRARVLPEEVPKTRWEMFAERKGIKKSKNKRGGRVYDEVTREHAPAYGRGSKSDLDRQWLIEVKEHEDPMVDRHALLKTKKKNNVDSHARREHLNLKRMKKLSHFQRGNENM